MKIIKNLENKFRDLGKSPRKQNVEIHFLVGKQQLEIEELKEQIKYLKYNNDPDSEEVQR